MSENTKNNNYASKPGSIRVKISEQYSKTGKELDVEFDSLSSYRENVEKYLKPMQKTVFPAALNDYFSENFNVQDWMTYVDKKNENKLKILKFEKNNIEEIIEKPIVSENKEELKNYENNLNEFKEEAKTLILDFSKPKSEPEFDSSETVMVVPEERNYEKEISEIIKPLEKIASEIYNIYLGDKNEEIIEEIKNQIISKEEINQKINDRFDEEYNGELVYKNIKEKIKEEKEILEMFFADDFEESISSFKEYVTNKISILDKKFKNKALEKYNDWITEIFKHRKFNDEIDFESKTEDLEKYLKEFVDCVYSLRTEVSYNNAKDQFANEKLNEDELEKLIQKERIPINFDEFINMLSKDSFKEEEKNLKIAKEKYDSFIENNETLNNILGSLKEVFNKAKEMYSDEKTKEEIIKMIKPDLISFEVDSIMKRVEKDVRAKEYQDLNNYILGYTMEIAGIGNKLTKLAKLNKDLGQLSKTQERENNKFFKKDFEKIGESYKIDDLNEFEEPNLEDMEKDAEKLRHNDIELNIKSSKILEDSKRLYDNFISKLEFFLKCKTIRDEIKPETLEILSKKK